MCFVTSHRNAFLLHSEIQSIQDYADQLILAIRAPQGTRLEVINPYDDLVRISSSRLQLKAPVSLTSGRCVT
jgi:hypothetical protein